MAGEGASVYLVLLLVDSWCSLTITLGHPLKCAIQSPNPNFPEKAADVMIIKCMDGSHVEIRGDGLVAMRLDGLSLHRAMLDGQDLQRASLVKADLRGAFISDANLDDAVLHEASLICAFLVRTTLRRTVLDGGRAIGCIFDDADLTDASLLGVDIGHASFSKARLHGAKLLCQRIEMASFAGATYDVHTRWPEGFDPIAAGAILES